MDINKVTPILHAKNAWEIVPATESYIPTIFCWS